MIHHIVLFKFNKGTSKKQIEDLANALEEMRDEISGIVNYVWGPSVSIENLEKGYTHGFIMTFVDKKSRNDYLPHTLHKQLVSKYVDPICENGLVFDIEENEEKAK